MPVDVRATVAGQRDVPSRVVEAALVELAGLRFTALDLGACERKRVSETVWLLGVRQSAFVGDLAFNGTPSTSPTAAPGASSRRSTAPRTLAACATLYVGRGAQATIAVLAEQRRYLLMARERLGRLAGGQAEPHRGPQVDRGRRAAWAGSSRCAARLARRRTARPAVRPSSRHRPLVEALYPPVLTTTSLSAPDSAPQTSPRRPWIWRTFASARRNASPG